MSNVLSTNEMAKNKVPDLLKDTLAVTGMIKDGIIDFAVLANVSYDSTDKMKTRDFANVQNDKIG